MANTKPEKTFRIGSVSASVFLNDGKSDNPFRSIVVQRSYKDGDDWKYTNSFTLKDAPLALAVLQKAMDYVLDKEAAAD